MNLKEIQFGRVYHKWSTSQLLRYKSFLFISSFNIIVKNLRNLYFGFGKIIGANRVNKIFEKMYSDIFIGGRDCLQLNYALSNLKTQGFVSISDFAIEFLGSNEEHKIPEIINEFIKTIDTTIQVDKDNMIAIKLSSLTPLHFMKSLNKLQLILSILENAYYNKTSYKNLHMQLFVYGLRGICNVNEANFEEYMEKLNGIFSSKLKNSSKKYKYNLSEYFCMAKDANNCVNEMKNFFNLDANFLLYLIDRTKKFESDLRKILNHAEEKALTVMIDAEQTYIQTGIDYFSAYLMKEYNKSDKCIVLNTLQMYLKNSVIKVKDFFEFCKENNINFGMKFVRGAYMIEEKQLAKSLKYPDPICNNLAETNYSYNSAINEVLNQFSPNDKIIFATHNVESIDYIGSLLHKKGILNPKGIIIAQLVGIGEHATWMAKDKLVRIYKYIKINLIINCLFILFIELKNCQIRSFW